MKTKPTKQPKRVPHKPISQVTSELLQFAAMLAQYDGMTVGDLQDAIDASIGLNPHIESINKGYQPSWAKSPYPFSMCVNINDSIIHSVPDRAYAFQKGDTVIFDLGIRDLKTKQCGDAALTVGIGEIEPWNQKLLRATKEALYLGIEAMTPGGSVYAPGEAMERYLRGQGLAVNKMYGGHSIGTVMHAGVIIPSHNANHAERAKWGFKSFQVGQVYCVEPIVTWHDTIGVQVDDWTIKTKNGRNGAMFEHMVEMTEDGPKILTTHISR